MTKTRSQIEAELKAAFEKANKATQAAIAKRREIVAKETANINKDKPS